MTKNALPIIGWREWVGLPDLSVARVKVKVDTGARSSALHAFDLHVVRRRGRDVVRFKVHPLQRSAGVTVEAEAVVEDYRHVKNS
ncbi:MAG TPA: RimK/LysX family protein, partial [bacterium]|nr:RimK/LysX family protein [bacterium]